MGWNLEPAAQVLFSECMGIKQSKFGCIIMHDEVVIGGWNVCSKYELHKSDLAVQPISALRQ